MINKLHSKDHIANGVHIMLDLETLGLNPGCAILQISAVAKVLDLGRTNYFDSLISIDSNASKGLMGEADTLTWWNKQDNLLVSKVFGGTNRIEFALANFSSWVKDMREGEPNRK